MTETENPPMSFKHLKKGETLPAKEYFVITDSRTEEVGILQAEGSDDLFIPAFADYDHCLSFLEECEVDGISEGFKRFYIRKVVPDDLNGYPVSVWFLHKPQPGIFSRLTSFFKNLTQRTKQSVPDA